MINKNPLELVTEEDRALVAEHLEERMNGTGNTRSLEFKAITKEGDIINIESFGALTHYEGKPAVLESVIDITRRKKAESELIKIRKMESVGILAGGIAHDFNNLLAVIVGNTSMMKLTFGEKNDKLNTFLDNVERASAQAADLAQKFITFSEGGWLMRKKVKLANVLRDTAQLSPEIKNISCEISIPPDLDFIFGDERQLRQVFTNLLLNAQESTADDNRKITVNAKNITLDNENPFSLKQGKYVKISVIDNGKGIPPELLEKIFDPYFTTKTTVSQKGLGLGLALCYSIVNKHGGHISIDSKVKEGTTVDMYLPVFGN
jgi:signal transduction histidine kinase